MQWVGMYGFNNTYGIAVRRDIAEKYQLRTYSDLKRCANGLTFGAEYDFISVKMDTMHCARPMAFTLDIPWIWI